jgi:hypothetical protein
MVKVNQLITGKAKGFLEASTFPRMNAESGHEETIFGGADRYRTREYFLRTSPSSVVESCTTG